MARCRSCLVEIRRKRAAISAREALPWGRVALAARPAQAKGCTWRCSPTDRPAAHGELRHRLWEEVKEPASL
jgi:hypothetical protein